VELEVKHLSGVPIPAARLLEARVLAFLGRDEEARALFDTITAIQAEARQSGTGDGLFGPNENVLLTLIDLCTREASDEEWAALHTRARTDSLESELVEVVEMTALAFARRGRIDRAREMLDEALALAEKIPNVMGKRLAQAQARLQAGASISHAS